MMLRKYESWVNPLIIVREAVKNKLTATKIKWSDSTEDGETNSRTSSLSLNNSGKSSISSGTADADHYAIRCWCSFSFRNLSTASSGNDFDFTAAQNQDSEMPTAKFIVFSW